MSTFEAAIPNEWASKPSRPANIGKASKVIDKIMSENDRLKRDLKLALATLEEEKQRGDSARAALEASKARNATIEAICEANEASVQRRDRKINELSVNLDAEQRRRRELQSTLQQRDDEIRHLEENARAQLGEMEQNRRRMQNEHDVLQSSLRQIEAAYQRSLRECQVDLHRIKLNISAQTNRIERLDSITETLETRSQSLDGNYGLYRRVCDRYRQGLEQLATNLRYKSEEVFSLGDNLISEMGVTLHTLKWSLALSDLRSNENDRDNVLHSASRGHD